MDELEENVQVRVTVGQGVWVDSCSVVRDMLE